MYLLIKVCAVTFMFAVSLLLEPKKKGKMFCVYVAERQHDYLKRLNIQVLLIGIFYFIKMPFIQNLDPTVYCTKSSMGFHKYHITFDFDKNQ